MIEDIKAIILAGNEAGNAAYKEGFEAGKLHERERITKELSLLLGKDIVV